MTDDTQQRPVDSLIREQAHRLFAQRVYLIVHFTLYAVALVLTRGGISRLGIIFAAWSILLLGHFAFYAVFEYREFVIRESYRKRKRREQQHNQSLEEVFYTVDDDGEIAPSAKTAPKQRQ